MISAEENTFCLTWYACLPPLYFVYRVDIYWTSSYFMDRATDKMGMMLCIVDHTYNITKLKVQTTGCQFSVIPTLLGHPVNTPCLSSIIHNLSRFWGCILNMSLSMFTPKIKCEKMLKIDLLPKLVNEGENQGACHLHWQLKNADYPKNFYISFLQFYNNGYFGLNDRFCNVILHEKNVIGCNQVYVKMIFFKPLTSEKKPNLYIGNTQLKVIFMGNELLSGELRTNWILSTNASWESKVKSLFFLRYIFSSCV